MSTTFADLPLSSFLHKQLAACGFSIPTPVQVAAIPHGLNGRDLLATAQTGTGKTLAFLVPALERLLASKGRHPQLLVLVPTRELAMQVLKQHDDLVGKTLPKAALIIGGASEQNQIQALRQGARVIVATPGRFEDLLGRRLVQIDRIEMLVLDEADRMLDMGFIPSIRRIVRQLPTQRQTMCFSATAEPSVASVMEEMLKNPERLAFGHTRRAAESVTLKAYEVDKNQKAALLETVVAGEAGKSIVFVGMKRAADRVADKLERAGVAVSVIHGNRSQSQRNRALDAFQQGRIKVLVATDVASRGIHVDDIAQVVNYDLPKLPEDFIHRVGRTGRAGASGIAVTFYTPLERRDVANLERVLQMKMERVNVSGALEREERGTIIDPATVRLVQAPRDSRSGIARGFMLEGEVMQRYSQT